MPELEEFAEALMDQLAVETGEEKEIAQLAERIAEDPSFDVIFASLQETAESALGPLKEALVQFTGIALDEALEVRYTNLDGFKRLKGSKVIAPPGSRQYVDDLFGAVAAFDTAKISSMIERDTARFLVYSTYAKAYISKISTTYGDYASNTVHLNEFVLSSYPQIILYKQGQPYKERLGQVSAGYRGAIKMTLLEEMAHSQQGPLHKINEEAALQVNTINEELAKIILDLDAKTASSLYEYLQLQTVPDDFPIAKKANLFFMLNPDNFIVNVLGPDVMTYTKVEIDPKISGMVPELHGIYQRWLGPMQAHHAAFTAMEGMAAYAVDSILGNDADFGAYLSAFMGTDISSYRVRKDMGRDFARTVCAELGDGALRGMLGMPPTTRELKEPVRYIERARGA